MARRPSCVSIRPQRAARACKLAPWQARICVCICVGEADSYEPAVRSRRRFYKQWSKRSNGLREETSSAHSFIECLVGMCCFAAAVENGPPGSISFDATLTGMHQREG